jgi:hypothetical protein
MNIIEKYSELNNDMDVIFHYAVELHPKPSPKDYINGYIIRYFVKKVNDYPIVEVSSQNYEKISKVMYSSVSIKWEISGEKNDVYNNNLKSIKNVENILVGISKKLKNPLQFYK